jgi:hypothetical protein
MQIKDLVQIGSEKTVSVHLQAMAAKYEKEAGRLWTMVELDSGARVWPGILRCVARQLTIIDAGQNLPIEVMAGAGKNALYARD